MKRTLFILALTATSLTGCLSLERRLDRLQYGETPYAKTQSYETHLNNGNRVDRQIQQKLAGLRENPHSAVLHNELGSLLATKGHLSHAERAFRRAIFEDSRFHPAWFNLGLVREARGDRSGAIRALARTVDLFPRYSEALFQLGLLKEHRGDRDAAIDLYARAFTINHALLDVKVNPRILDSKLVDLTLIQLYPSAHQQKSLDFTPAPTGYIDTLPREAPSPQPEASSIVTPSAPTTDPGTQTPPPGNEAEPPPPAPLP